MKAITLLSLILLAGCSTQGNVSETSSAAKSTDSQTEVFRTVLQGWLDENKRGNSVYVSKYTYKISESELEEFTSCANHGAVKPVTLTPQPKAKLSGVAVSPRFHFINRRFWLMPDEESINRSTETGRPTGILSLSSVAFNPEKSVAVLHFSYVCGSLCGGGETLVLDKTASGWIQRSATCHGWIS